MTGKRKRYSADFKAKVALEALRGELTTAHQVAEAGDRQAVIAAAAGALALAGGRHLDGGDGDARSFSASARSWSWNKMGPHASRRCHSTRPSCVEVLA